MNDAITVAELIAILKDAPPEGLVWITPAKGEAECVRAVEIFHTPHMEHPSHVTIKAAI